MILMYSLQSIALGVLYCTLTILLCVIAYRKLLRHLGKDELVKEEYVTLYTIEKQPVIETVEFYYEVTRNREVRLELLDEQMQVLQVIDEREATTGGNIVRFDTLKVSNGRYFYQMVTDNQKTSKKLWINNPI